MMVMFNTLNGKTAIVDAAVLLVADKQVTMMYMPVEEDLTGKTILPMSLSKYAILDAIRAQTGIIDLTPFQVTAPSKGALEAFL